MTRNSSRRLRQLGQNAIRSGDKDDNRVDYLGAAAGPFAPERRADDR